jgi:hypothetical protein
MPSSYQFVLWKQESFLVPSAFFRNLLGQEIAMTAIKLRALALLALCFLYVRIAMPDLQLSLLQVPTRYEYLVEEVARLARFKRLVQANRILGAL